MQPVHGPTEQLPHDGFSRHVAVQFCNLIEIPLNSRGRLVAAHSRSLYGTTLAERQALAGIPADCSGRMEAVGWGIFNVNFVKDGCRTIVRGRHRRTT